MNKTLPKILALAGFILLPLAIGGVAGVITADSVNAWYSHLTKPTFTPPAFIFAPVWTALYLLMGISSYLIWNKKGQQNISWAMSFYFLQLSANFMWSLLFFGNRNPLLGLIDIAILWFLIVGMILSFYRVDKRAGLLQIPYLLWVYFASILNFYVWFLN